MEPYYFFFSYARTDLRGGQLIKFFEDLHEEVFNRITEGNPGFRDEDNIAPGDDYIKELKEALQTSRTLVCIFSTRFFTREWCGKEFQVFLDRQPQVEIVDGVAEESDKIIPVLWQGHDVLEVNDLPPRVAERIQQLLVGPEGGLHHYMRTSGRRSVYWDTVETLAAQIVERVREDPLPPLDVPPDFAKTPNAFAERIPEENTAIEGPNTLVLLYPWVGAGDAASAYKTWKPYPGHRPIKSLLSELVEDFGYTPVAKPIEGSEVNAYDQIKAILAEANQEDSKNKLHLGSTSLLRCLA